MLQRLLIIAMSTDTAADASPTTDDRFKSMIPSTADLYRQLGIVRASTLRFVPVSSKLTGPYQTLQF